MTSPNDDGGAGQIAQHGCARRRTGADLRATTPPRAMRSRRCRGARPALRMHMISGECAVALPPSRPAQSAPGQAGTRALRITSSGAAASCPAISPMPRGQRGGGRLRAGSKRPSASSRRRASSMRASRAPSPAGSIRSARGDNSARLSYGVTFPCTWTLASTGRSGRCARRPSGTSSRTAWPPRRGRAAEEGETEPGWSAAPRSRPRPTGQTGRRPAARQPRGIDVGDGVDPPPTPLGSQTRMRSASSDGQPLANSRTRG